MAVLWVLHLVRHEGAGQSTINLSSGENKHYAMSRATSVDVRIAIRCDSGVVKTMSVCPEAGQMTAPDMRQLWLQQQ
eukprot:14167516-Heterocapsa_arctica.AAC.1